MPPMLIMVSRLRQMVDSCLSHCGLHSIHPTHPQRPGCSLPLRSRPCDFCLSLDSEKQQQETEIWEERGLIFLSPPCSGSRQDVGVIGFCLHPISGCSCISLWGPHHCPWPFDLAELDSVSFQDCHDANPLEKILEEKNLVFILSDCPKVNPGLQGDSSTPGHQKSEAFSSAACQNSSTEMSWNISSWAPPSEHPTSVDLGLGGILCGGALGKWMRWGSPGPGHRLCKVFQVMLTHGQAQETLS